MQFSLWIRLSACLCGGTWACVAMAQSPSFAERVAVAQLLSSPHGLERLNPEQKNILASITGNPKPYLPILEEMVASVPEQVSANSEARLRYERVLLLLARIKDPDAVRILKKAYAETDRRLRETSGDTLASPQGSFLLSTRRLVVEGLRNLGDKALVTETLGTLETEDHATQIVFMRYLADVAKGDATVQRSLRDMLNRPNSSLHGNPQLRRTLEAVDGQATGSDLNR